MKGKSNILCNYHGSSIAPSLQIVSKRQGNLVCKCTLFDLCSSLIKIISPTSLLVEFHCLKVILFSVQMMYRHVVLYLKVAAFHCKAICIPMVVEMMRISLFIDSYVGNTITRRHADYSFCLIFQLVIISSNTFLLGKSSRYIVSLLHFNTIELDHLSHLTLFK